MTSVAQRTLLVIEDDTAVRQGLVDILTLEGYGLLEAPDGDVGLDKALSATCDLILLDLVMPGKSGLEILEEVRRHRPTLPVIIMTALGDEADRIKGLKLGADDYVVKPFSTAELTARIEAVLRRSPERAKDIKEIPVKDGVVRPATAEVRFSDGTTTSLSEKELQLITYFASHPDRIISRDEILQRIWRLDPKGVSTRTIDMHVARLRDKLRDHDQTTVVTIRGKGYRYSGPAL